MSEGRLTTHVLDLARGIPAAGVFMELRRLERDRSFPIRSVRTNADGRLDAPLLEGPEMIAGEYELLFHAGDYFRRLEHPASPAGPHGGARNGALGGIAGDDGDPGFLDLIPIRFHIRAEGGHYHVPLLLAPGGYSTYRGS
ncbi:hydroxyisourate hydrolase [Paenibacillus macerans]|uniref:hydroxyisourate hydrolase n=1 Tax=Paenibacillus macerans TaxID=44252 RepID=UPI003D310AC3